MGGAPGRRCLCFGAKPKQRVWARHLPRDRKWRRKERSDRRQGPVNEDRWRGSWQRSAEESGRLWIGCPENYSQQKSERRLLWPDELHRGRVNQREKMSALLVPFVEVSRKIHASDSLQTHGECKVSPTDFPFLALGADPSPCLFVSSSIFSVVFFYGRKEM